MPSAGPADPRTRPGRPDWLTAGLVRLLPLSAFIVGIGMLSPRLDRDEAWLVLGVGALLGAIRLELRGLAARGRSALPGVGRVRVKIAVSERSRDGHVRRAWLA